jgi:hypothetical protein
MRRFLLAGLGAAAILAAAPASAQYYGGGYGGGGYGGGGYGSGGYQRGFEDDEDDYRPRRRYRVEREYGDGYGGGGYGRGGYVERPRQRRVQSGSLCVTSRGVCETGTRLPANTGCGCNIPGFGYKRGAIGAGT